MPPPPKKRDNTSSRGMTWRILTLGLWAVVWASFSLAHESYRENLPQPTVEIHKSLLQYAENREFDKIKNYLNLLKSLTATFQEKFGINIEKEILTALSQKEVTLVEKTLQHFIYLDIQDLLSIAKTWSKGSFNIEHAKTDIQAAYLNYLLLSPFAQEKHFSSDQKIKNLFRKVNLSLIRITPYKNETVDTVPQKAKINEMQEWITEIEDLLKAIWESP